MFGVPVRCGRLGYTGERGFELIVAEQFAEELWRSSRADAIRNFCDSGCITKEAGFILSVTTLPFERICRFFDLQRCYPSVTRLKKSPLLCWFSHRSIQSASCVLMWQHPEVKPPWPSRGELAVTSACFSPLANATLGLGFVLTTDLSEGVELADPLGDFQSVRITSRPYYDPLKLKVRGGWDSLLQPDP